MPMASALSKFSLLESFSEDTVTADELRLRAISLGGSQTHEAFWRLAFDFLRADASTCEKNRTRLLDVLTTYCSKYTGAAFALANLYGKIKPGDEQKDLNLELPKEPYAASVLCQLLSEAGITLPLSKTLWILYSPDVMAQRRAAKVISSMFSEKQALIDSVFEALASVDGALALYRDQKDFSSPIIQKRGLVILLGELLPEGVDVSRIISTLLPFLQAQTTSLDHKKLVLEVQKLFSRLLTLYPAQFHSVPLVSTVQQLSQSSYLDPAYLASILSSYGLYASKKLIPLFVEQMEELIANNRQILDAISPYVGQSDQDTIDSFCRHIVTALENRPFDKDLYLIAAKAFASLAPCVSAYFGRFNMCLSKTRFAAQIRPYIHPLLEPKGPAPLFPLNRVVILDEEDKRHVETMAVPQYSNIEVQLDIESSIHKEVI